MHEAPAHHEHLSHSTSGRDFCSHTWALTVHGDGLAWFGAPSPPAGAASRTATTFASSVIHKDLCHCTVLLLERKTSEEKVTCKSQGLFLSYCNTCTSVAFRRDSSHKLLKGNRNKTANPFKCSFPTFQQPRSSSGWTEQNLLRLAADQKQAPGDRQTYTLHSVLSAP